MGALSYVGLTTDDPERMATAYTAIGLFAVPLLLVLGLLTLATGGVLAVGTRVGLVRYWVLAKLVISLVLVILVVVALRPVLDDAASQSVLRDATLPDRLRAVRFDLVFNPVVSTLALVFAAWLGIYKPWGRTPLRHPRVQTTETTERVLARLQPGRCPSLEPAGGEFPHRDREVMGRNGDEWEPAKARFADRRERGRGGPLQAHPTTVASAQVSAQLGCRQLVFSRRVARTSRALDHRPIRQRAPLCPAWRSLRRHLRRRSRVLRGRDLCAVQETGDDGSEGAAHEGRQEEDP